MRDQTCCHLLYPQTHLPGYVDNYDVLKTKGVEVVVCVSVNDAFVMEAWGKSQGAIGKIRMLADTSGEFTKVCSNSSLCLECTWPILILDRLLILVSTVGLFLVDSDPRGKPSVYLIRSSEQGCCGRVLHSD